MPALYRGSGELVSQVLWYEAHLIRTFPYKSILINNKEVPCLIPRFWQLMILTLSINL